MPVTPAEPEQSIPAIPVKKKRVRRAPRKPVVPKIEVKTIAAKSRPSLPASATMFVVLLALLVFSGTNLYIAVNQYGSFQGLRQSWDTLMQNYRLSNRTVVVQQPAPIPAPTPERAVALYSVVQGESLIPSIESMVVNPLEDYYAAVGKPLEAVYVERRVATSQLIRVHLFFRDGTDEEFLWPFTGKATDWWVPDCSLSVEPAAGQTACPLEFLYKYPAIAQELGK